MTPIASCLVTTQERDHDASQVQLVLPNGKRRHCIQKECELEELHDVDTGNAYRTTPFVQSFTKYITEAQRQEFLQAISKKHFYSDSMDGSTDAGKLEWSWWSY